MNQLNLFSGSLSVDLAANLAGLNPWWRGKPSPAVPRFKRWLFPALLQHIHKGLTPAVVLRGPRRVGKTVLIRQTIENLLNETVSAKRILYVPFDDIEGLLKLPNPVLAIARWFESEILERTFNEAAQAGEIAYLFFDEVQNLNAWAPQVKHLVDNHSVRLLLTGSSSLRIEAGRDSLAGRITTLDLGPMLLREIAGLRFGFQGSAYWKNGTNGLTDPDFWTEGAKQSQKDTEIRLKSFQAFSERGAYPIAHERENITWPEIADYLNETVIKRAIQHDLRIGRRGEKRDEKLLEEVFRLCCRYAGQNPGPAAFLPEIQQALAGNIGWNRVLNYLKFLDGTLLIRLAHPLEIRLKKRHSPPKICLCDHALRASWLQEIIPLDTAGLYANPHLADLAGRIAESVLGYYFLSVPNLDAAYFPARAAEPEVDFVLTVGTKRIPVEVKYRKRIDPYEDTLALRAFLEKTVYKAPFGILVTLDDNVSIPDRRILPISLSSLLWLR